MSERDGTLTVGASDLELVERHRRGDPSAFESIVQQYTNLIYTLSFRLTGNREDAQDLHQEVLLKVFRSLARFRGQASLRTWIYRITVNAARNRARWWSRAKRGTAQSLDASYDDDGSPPSERIADTAPGPDGRAYGKEIQARVQEGLDQLPVNQRTVVVLRDIEGLDYREIAAALEISLGTVKSRLARGRDALRSQLADLLE